MAEATFCDESRRNWTLLSLSLIDLEIAMSQINNAAAHPGCCPEERYGPSTEQFSARGKRSISTDQAAKHLTREGTRFHDRDRDGKTQVSFNLSSFTEQQKNCARRAMQAWQDVADISFHENARKTDGSIQVSGAHNSDRGVAWRSGEQNSKTTAQIGTKGVSHDPKPGSHFHTTMIHEIGHCLGLAHPGHYNGGGTYEKNAQFAQDTKAGTVMSYWSEREHAGHNFKNLGPSAPMMYDIAAVQSLYGANRATRNTDTTYGFNSNTEREALSVKSAADSAIFCVWDGGGNDTLDFSGYSQNQNINLNEQSFSDVGGLKGNVSIAKGVTLENAIGGSGNDRLTGNDADNRLKGGRGADTLRGGGGADTFAYDKASDSTLQNPDRIEDFTSGTDKIDVSGALKEAGIKDLNFSSQFNGRPGNAVLSHDASTGRGSLAIDMSGNGKPDFLLNTVGKIQASDVVTSAQTPKPSPSPSPAPAPEPAASLLATLASVLQGALMMLQGLMRLLEKSQPGQR